MKKEINPNNLNDSESLLQYIINSTTNKYKNYTHLTQDQKDRLFSVIKSNLKTEENQNNTNQNYNYNKNKDGELGLDYINEEEEEDNLGYKKHNKENKDKIMNKRVSIGDYGEKKKISFCSKKRKNTSDYFSSVNENKIFNIKKDMNHKRSMDITKNSDNIINNLKINAQEINKTSNEINNGINNINNNNIYINSNKTGNLNNFNNKNYIIQNNYINIINNFNNVNNQGNINFNISNNPINNLQNNIFNPYLNNDSINSDINNHNYKFYNKEKIIKNNMPEILEYEKKNINTNNPLENYTFLNNENFFPNLNKNNDNYNKNYDNIEQNLNDPFNLKFENVTVHNEHNDNNTIINDNLFLNNNIEEAHDLDDSEFDRMHFGRNNNNISEKPYDDD